MPYIPKSFLSILGEDAASVNLACLPTLQDVHRQLRGRWNGTCRILAFLIRALGAFPLFSNYS